MSDSTAISNLIFQSEALQPTSLSEQTANRIRSMINTRKLLPGSRLPNEVELAEAMGVSRGTMRTALNILQEQGLIWRRQGIGSFVSEQPILENRLDINSGVTELITSMGLKPGNQILEAKIIPADEFLSEKLALPTESPLAYIRRIRTADEKPVVSSVDIFPATILQQSPQINTLEKFVEVLLQNISIYRVFEQYFGLAVEYGINRLKPVKVTARLKKQLGLSLQLGDVMLYMEQLDYDRNRNPFYLSYEYHVAEFCNFTIFRRR